MNDSKPLTKEDVELETLITFLKNDGIEFNPRLIELNNGEIITDIRYNAANYQITIGDKEAAQERRRALSKNSSYVTFRNVFDIVPFLLKGSLTKKSLRSDRGTVLLIDVGSTGNLDWEELSAKVSNWAKNNSQLCLCWKDIYLVYDGKNIKIDF